MDCSETVNKILKIKESKIQAYSSEEHPVSVRAALQRGGGTERVYSDLLPASRIFSRRGIGKKKCDEGLHCEHLNKQVLLHLGLEDCNLDCWQIKTTAEIQNHSSPVVCLQPEVVGEEQKLLATALFSFRGL